MVAVETGVSFGCFGGGGAGGVVGGGGVCVGVGIGVLVGVGVLIGVLVGVGVKPASAGATCQVFAARATRLKTKTLVMILLGVKAISLYETNRGSYRAPY